MTPHTDMVDVVFRVIWAVNLGVVLLAACFSAPFRAHNED